MMWRAARKKSPLRSLVEGSGLFDEAYYVARNPDCGSREPLDHYLEQGWRDGLDPGPDFSTLYYLCAYPDIEAAGINPLAHYAEHGRSEGRHARPDDDLPSLPGEVPEPVVPTLADFLRLAAEEASGVDPAVDVVVPVYRGFSETLRCLYSVLSARQRTPHRLVVVYDHGPSAALRNALLRLSKLDLIDLLEMPRNVGFVRSCNTGIARHPRRDVVLLNSDTEVHGDWLDRLRRAALGGEKVATVTPLSNNAEICSYPKFVFNNRAAIEIDDAELDRLIAQTNRGLTVPLPTGVGFCLYVRREALDAVGALSEEHFGRGYGEENDLCRRADAAGWSNLLAADVFVRHYGGRSFGADKSHLVDAAVRTVETLHPGYNALIQHFLAQDPVRPLREAIDMARLKRRLAGRPAFLFVAHNWGGGTERHVRELADRLEAEGTPVLICRPADREGDHIAISDPRTPGLHNMPRYGLRAGPSGFVRHLAELNIVHIHIHQLVDYGGPSVEFFRAAAQLLGCRYDVTLHDYAYACPRITMVGRDGRYCGEPSLDVCESCARTGQVVSLGTQGVWEWRERSLRFLTDARKVFTPSRDTARRYARYLPARELTVRPHFGTDVADGPLRRTGDREAGRIIAVIGAIGQPKGSDLVYACATLARQHHPGLRFHIVGYTDRDPEFLALGNVTITGRYEDDEIDGILADTDACAAWFPAVWPETFSYTLSAAFAARLMPIAFDFGAIAERIRDAGWGVLLPPATMMQPEALLDDLANAEITLPPRRLRTGEAYASIVRDYYEGPTSWGVAKGEDR